MRTQFDFSEALIYMKAGYRVQRTGWNGADQWVCLGEGGNVTPANLWNKHTRAFAESLPEQRVVVLPYFILKTAQGAILMGWSPSQSDALAEDWQFVPDAA